MQPDFNPLCLKYQLCFPLYACSREIIKQYRPHLEELDLTYTQYITMMVVWERQEISVRDLGKELYLDSGTLTPVLKSLEQKGFISRSRSEQDERLLIVKVTPSGMELRKRAESVPLKMAGCMNLTPEEAGELYRLLYKVLGKENADE
ncbi:MAG TPA: MarR family transcriptional regulator [Ruminococcus sp.]|nr:MarR family transcriptional regulator [Ruminococcus sp.]